MLRQEAYMEVPMKMAGRGFVLVIVVGVIGVLSSVAVVTSMESRLSAQLSKSHSDRVMARLAARSGVEDALSTLASTPLLHQTKDFNKTIMVSRGSAPGIPVLIESKDLSGRININDGLEAGRLELGGDYKQNDVNPWPAPLFPHDPDFSESAWINLRLRRLLNAYGEALRLELSIPGTVFRFLSDASGPRGDRVRYQNNAHALGDVIISARPPGGYSSIAEIQDLVNDWSIRVGLDLPPGVHEGYALVSQDLTASGFVDDSVVRLLSEEDLGEFTSQNLYDVMNKSRVTPVSLISNPPDLRDRFTPHPTAVINLNHASKLVKTAVFYAPTNVSLPVVTGMSYRHPEMLDPSVDTAEMAAPLPDYAHTSLPALAMGGTVFDADALWDVGGHWTVGPDAVQVNHLMPLQDAAVLADAFDVFDDETGVDIVNKETFKEFLRWHWESHLPSIKKSLTWAVPPGVFDPVTGKVALEPFDDSPGGGEFLQNYLELILPEILGGSRRLPRWMGAPSCLLSPLYQPVKPSVSGLAGSRGLRTVEDFCYRLTHPKVIFLPSGHTWIRSRSELPHPEQGRCEIETRLITHTSKTWRSQRSFEALVDRGSLDGTTVGVRLGPEWTDAEGGGFEPDPHLGHIGLRESVADIDYGDDVPLISVAADPDSVNSKFSKFISPDDPHADPYFSSPYEINEEVIPQLERMSLKGTQNPVTKTWYSTFGTPENSSNLSPFGGLMLHSYGHGLNAESFENVFLHGAYWQLSGRTVNPPASGSPPNSAGSEMNRGLVNFWLRLPTNYPYAHAASAESAFQTVFSITVWDVTQPVHGINSMEEGFLGAVVRPVEIKTGVVWNPLTQRHDLVARVDQSRCGDITRKTRVNNLLYFKQVANDTYLDESLGETGDPFYPVPFLLGAVSPSSPIMAIPSGDGILEHWTSDQSRLIESVLHLDPTREDTMPGNWVRVSVAWDLRPLGAPADCLTLRLLETGRTGSVTKSAWTGSTDVDHDVGYMPKNLMMSYGAQNVFTLGESLACGGIANFHSEVNKMAGPRAGVIPRYSAWRLNSSVSGVDVFFGTIPENLADPTADPYLSAGPARRFQSFSDQHVTLRPEQLISESGPEQMTDLDGADVLAFGVVAYRPENEDHAPPLRLACYQGGRTSSAPLTPSAASANGDTVCLDFKNDRLVNDMALEAIWDMAAVPDSNLVHSAPWIQDVRIHFRPKDYPRILDWKQQP